MKRREIITVLGGGAMWPLTAHAQKAIPVIGFLSTLSKAQAEPPLGAFMRGLNESGFKEGQNVEITYQFAEGRIRQTFGHGEGNGPSKSVSHFGSSAPGGARRQSRDLRHTHRICRWIRSGRGRLGRKPEQAWRQCDGDDTYKLCAWPEASGDASRACAEGFSHRHARQSGQSRYRCRSRGGRGWRSGTQAAVDAVQRDLAKWHRRSVFGAERNKIRCAHRRYRPVPAR